RPGRFDLDAHQLDDTGSGADKLNVARFTYFREVRGLCQKAIAGMNRIDIEYLGGADYGGNIQVALGGRSRPDADRLVGKAHVQRVAINVAMDRDCADAHLFTRPDDAAGNLAAIGELNLSKFPPSLGYTEYDIL